METGDSIKKAYCEGSDEVKKCLKTLFPKLLTKADISYPCLMKDEMGLIGLMNKCESGYVVGGRMHVGYYSTDWDESRFKVIKDIQEVNPAWPTCS